MNREQVIITRLNDEFAPTHLDVINESHMHAGPASESHFKVVVVSDHFAGKRLLQRHRAINQALSNEFEQGLHALAIHTYTGAEWNERQQTFPSSPNCVGQKK